MLVMYHYFLSFCLTYSNHNHDLFLFLFLLSTRLAVWPYWGTPDFELLPGTQQVYFHIASMLIVNTVHI